MKLKDLGFWFRDFWAEFRREGSGLVGLALLILFLLVTIFENPLLPFKEANTRWRDITYWQDNPINAPPVWTNLFAAKKAARTANLERGTRQELTNAEGETFVTESFVYHFKADKAPLDIIVHSTLAGSVPLTVEVQRPDGTTLQISQRYVEYDSPTPVRFSVNNDSKDSLFAFLKLHEAQANLSRISSGSIRSTEILFNKAREGMAASFESLKGDYRFTIKAQVLNREQFSMDDTRLVVTGSVSGLLGTDNMKRDIFSGLVAGLKWALFIGLFTSAVSVLIGVFYGIMSAYFGGIVDTIMQFIYQIFVSIPLLPVLIVVSAVFKPSIWFLIGVMVIFFWPGSVMTVRSMAFQIKEETYIEAARALGAGHRRIIFNHMAPLLIPYSFASMALSVPSAIVYESSVSLLGLGDASIVTWGQILHDAMLGNAILNGLWWWVIPPGLAIAIMGMTFAFLGFAMDRILHPKLRTR
ncbi:ABC transporter permease [Gracilinema caldarium]|uniref:ABC transporter permease n=1 Tax=Gracilinema caldarium TaxID=215591 RepID=UPI0026EAD977|nr:ABC transporter permease [Gracilinema caldarium]